MQRFAQQRELQRRPQTNTGHKGGAPHSEENKADILIKVLVFDFDYIEYWIEYVKVYHYMLYLKWFDLGLIKICFVGGVLVAYPEQCALLFIKGWDPSRNLVCLRPVVFLECLVPTFLPPVFESLAFRKKNKPNPTLQFSSKQSEDGVLSFVLSQCNLNRDAGFQQPTVSSQLRVNQVPQKEHSVPWMPTSPHSSPRQRCAFYLFADLTTHEFFL